MEEEDEDINFNTTSTLSNENDDDHGDEREVEGDVETVLSEITDGVPLPPNSNYNNDTLDIARIIYTVILLVDVVMLNTV